MPLGSDSYREWFGSQFLHHPADVLFVLLRVERASAVDEQPPVVEARPCVADNVALQLPAFLYILRAPFTDGSYVLAEHALSGARHIAEDEVELQFRLTIVVWIIVGNDMVLIAPFGRVLQKDAGALAQRLVGVEKAVFGQG